jgi:pSer/pThr/pTyr-binding forkhead associated (FHA) protein
MPKLILVTKGKRRSEWSIGDGEVLIGRGLDCDVRLNDPSVSRHHARVVKIQGGYCVEDLKSTNGVIVNGVHVERKHMLKDGDDMQVGIHELYFEMDEGSRIADQPRTAAAPGAVGPTGRQEQAGHTGAETLRRPPLERIGGAYVRYLSGPDQGNTMRLERTLFTIGQPGGNLAVISRRAQGYFLMHLGGDYITTRNDEPVYGAGVELEDGDIVQVGDIGLEFNLDN